MKNEDLTPMVEVRDLTKKFGELAAVDGISFDIAEGEIFGLLGPNGAGKTTTISVLSCLLAATGGSVKIAGYDVNASPNSIKQIIGVVPQDIALYPTLSARGNLTLFGKLWGLRGRELKNKIQERLKK